MIVFIEIMFKKTKKQNWDKPELIVYPYLAIYIY